MTQVTIALINYEDGGLGPGGYDYTGFTRAFADLDTAPELIMLYEAKQRAFGRGAGSTAPAPRWMSCSAAPTSASSARLEALLKTRVEAASYTALAADAC